MEYSRRDVAKPQLGKKSSTGSKQKRNEEEAGPSTRWGEMEESSEETRTFQLTPQQQQPKPRILRTANQWSNTKREELKK